MDRIPAQSSDVLLARINRELERISEVQHRLARRRTMLQHHATRLRLGASPTEIRFALKAAVAAEQRWGFEWSTAAEDRRHDREPDR